MNTLRLELRYYIDNSDNLHPVILRNEKILDLL